MEVVKVADATDHLRHPRMMCNRERRQFARSLCRYFGGRWWFRTLDDGMDSWVDFSESPESTSRVVLELEDAGLSSTEAIAAAEDLLKNPETKEPPSADYLAEDIAVTLRPRVSGSQGLRETRHPASCTKCRVSHSPEEAPTESSTVQPKDRGRAHTAIQLPMAPDYPKPGNPLRHTA